MKVGKDFIN